MADIFISYARADRESASRLAEALTGAGATVWWDRALKGGSAFHDEIERELTEAQRVIVLWSAQSNASHWVRDEAGMAQELGKLTPLLLDNRPPPLGFRSFHSQVFEEVLADVASFLGGMGLEVAERAGSAAAHTTSDAEGESLDLRYNLAIPLETAFTGAVREITFPRSVRCTACEAKSDPNCPKCKGAKVVQKESSISINLPPGLRQGARIRFAGMGDFGAEEQSAGDLYVFINVENGVYSLEGDDLHATMPVPRSVAETGTDHTIPTVDGGQLRMKIPAGVKNGQVLRLAGKGMPATPQGEKGGDILIRVEITD